LPVPHCNVGTSCHLEADLRDVSQAGATHNMSSGVAVEAVPWPHTFEAAKDEARLIQDSLLPSGTLRGDGFEVAFRFSPLREVGGDFADFFQLPSGLVGFCVPHSGDRIGEAARREPRQMCSISRSAEACRRPCDTLQRGWARRGKPRPSKAGASSRTPRNGARFTGFGRASVA